MRHYDFTFDHVLPEGNRLQCHGSESHKCIRYKNNSDINFSSSIPESNLIEIIVLQRVYIKIWNKAMVFTSMAMK